MFVKKKGYELCPFHFCFYLTLGFRLLTECRQNSLSVTTMTALVEKGGILFVILR